MLYYYGNIVGSGQYCVAESPNGYAMCASESSINSFLESLKLSLDIQTCESVYGGDEGSIPVKAVYSQDLGTWILESLEEHGNYLFDGSLDNPDLCADYSLELVDGSLLEEALQTMNRRMSSMFVQKFQERMSFPQLFPSSKIQTQLLNELTDCSSILDSFQEMYTTITSYSIDYPDIALVYDDIVAMIDSIKEIIDNISDQLDQFDPYVDGSVSISSSVDDIIVSVSDFLQLIVDYDTQLSNMLPYSRNNVYVEMTKPVALGNIIGHTLYGIILFLLDSEHTIVASTSYLLDEYSPDYIRPDALSSITLKLETLETFDSTISTFNDTMHLGMKNIDSSTFSYVHGISDVFSSMVQPFEIDGDILSIGPSRSISLSDESTLSNGAYVSGNTIEMPASSILSLGDFDRFSIQLLISSDSTYEYTLYFGDGGYFNINATSLSFGTSTYFKWIVESGCSTRQTIQAITDADLWFSDSETKYSVMTISFFDDSNISAYYGSVEFASCMEPWDGEKPVYIEAITDVTISGLAVYSYDISTYVSGGGLRSWIDLSDVQPLYVKNQLYLMYSVSSASNNMSYVLNPVSKMIKLALFIDGLSEGNNVNASLYRESQSELTGFIYLQDCLYPLNPDVLCSFIVQSPAIYHLRLETDIAEALDIVMMDMLSEIKIKKISTEGSSTITDIIIQPDGNIYRNDILFSMQSIPICKNATPSLGMSPTCVSTAGIDSEEIDGQVCLSSSSPSEDISFSKVSYSGNEATFLYSSEMISPSSDSSVCFNPSCSEKQVIFVDNGIFGLLTFTSDIDQCPFVGSVSDYVSFEDGCVVVNDSESQLDSVILSTNRGSQLISNGTSCSIIDSDSSLSVEARMYGSPTKTISEFYETQTITDPSDPIIDIPTSIGIYPSLTNINMLSSDNYGYFDVYVDVENSYYSNPIISSSFGITSSFPVHFQGIEDITIIQGTDESEIELVSSGVLNIKEKRWEIDDSGSLFLADSCNFSLTQSSCFDSLSQSIEDISLLENNGYACCVEEDIYYGIGIPSYKPDEEEGEEEGEDEEEEETVELYVNEDTTRGVFSMAGIGTGVISLCGVFLLLAFSFGISM
ncbi:hypothetical protein ADUPG1_013460 [Aduncisulcus paluster]|uniref:Uncharacterized protein n=1 Tax=Aduncisulcus paluster TaxID=2918883 RepID=A0ABQ5K7S2_9EUKA|nr:hypothetical protein ADUPG1_013460 [Aduncisulcus paluster]